MASNYLFWMKTIYICNRYPLSLNYERSFFKPHVRSVRRAIFYFIYLFITDRLFQMQLLFQIALFYSCRYIRDVGEPNIHKKTLIGEFLWACAGWLFLFFCWRCWGWNPELGRPTLLISVPGHVVVILG